jgi:hypothetical protein
VYQLREIEPVIVYQNGFTLPMNATAAINR